MQYRDKSKVEIKLGGLPKGVNIEDRNDSAKQYTYIYATYKSVCIGATEEDSSSSSN